jgi:hypothetical protein
VRTAHANLWDDNLRTCNKPPFHRARLIFNSSVNKSGIIMPNRLDWTLAKKGLTLNKKIQSKRNVPSLISPCGLHRLIWDDTLCKIGEAPLFPRCGSNTIKYHTNKLNMHKKIKCVLFLLFSVSFRALYEVEVLSL